MSIIKFVLSKFFNILDEEKGLIIELNFLLHININK